MVSRDASDHFLAAAISREDRRAVARLLLGGFCNPNNRLVVDFPGIRTLHLRRPLELALCLTTSVCLHAAAPCHHCDCLLAAPDSMLRLLIRLGANINLHNCLIDHVTLFGPIQPLYPGESDLLEKLETRMRAVKCSEEQWEALRRLYAKDEHLLLDAVRGCIENGLQWDPNVPRSSVVPRTVIVRAVRWFLELQRVLCVLVNLWLCGFSLVVPSVDLPTVREFHLLPRPLQLKACNLAAEALAISRPPVKLQLQARGCIRKALPLADFRSSARGLQLPESLRRFVLFAERF